MTSLAELNIRDIRALLPRRDWTIGRRVATTSLTWHWNGPAVAEARRRGPGVIEQLVADSHWQMQRGWGGTRDGAPHLMYHVEVDAAGVIYQSCDLNEILWHCAHQDGNGCGLALHYLVGEGQTVTSAQLASGIRVSDALLATYCIPRSRVLGHLEWKHATACPGPDLMAHLHAYRAHSPIETPQPTIVGGLRRFRVLPSLTLPAKVRQAPRTEWPDGREVGVASRLKPGTIIFVDVVKTDGEAVEGDRRWAHMARVANEQADLGFVSMTLLEEVA